MLLAVSIIVAICGTHFVHGQGPEPKPAELSGSYHSRAWDFVGVNCAHSCNNHEDGYMCSRSSQSFLHCNCWGCTRECRLSEAAVSLNHCASAQKKIEELEVDVAGHLSDLSAQLAIDLISNVPVVGGVASAALNFGKGMFDIGEKEDLLNGAIRDMNSRMDAMSKCMGQMIDASEVRDVAGEIKIAFWRYDHAITFDGDASEKMEQFEDAWKAHVDVTESKLYILNKPKEYFVKLLMEVQDFAQSFALVSFDYLTYLHELDETNYKDAFERTLEAFWDVRTWADKARSVTLSSLSKQMRSKPCNNGAFLDNEMTKWNTAFTKMNIYPIDSYIGELYTMHYTLITKYDHDPAPLYIKGSTGLSWNDAEEFCQNTYGTHLATITSDAEARMAMEIAGGWAWIGLNRLSGSWKWSDGKTGCDYVSNNDCKYDPRWNTGEPTEGNEKCAYIRSDRRFNDNPCTTKAPVLCNSPSDGWTMGAKGATCDDTCQSKGLRCDADKQSTITSASAIKNAFAEAGHDCQGYIGHRDYAGAPFTNDNHCYYLTPGAKSVCNDAKDWTIPLCYCK